MRRIELIPEWRRALRMLSVQANTINAAGLTAWATLGDLRDKIPVEVVVAFAIAMLVLGTVGRLVKQRKVSASSARQDDRAQAAPTGDSAQ
jgi:hypothetical protein